MSEEILGANGNNCMYYDLPPPTPTPSILLIENQRIEMN